jgi:hypothetical protein
MTPRYDIFKLEDGAPIWTATADSAQEVRVRISLLRSDSVRECIVVDRATGNRSIVSCEQVGLENPAVRPSQSGPPGAQKLPSNYRHA